MLPMVCWRKRSGWGRELGLSGASSDSCSSLAFLSAEGEPTSS